MKSANQVHYLQLVSLFVSFALALAGCGRDENKDSMDAVALPERVLTPPATYLLADEECQDLGTEVALKEATIPAWQADQVNMVPVSLNATFSGNSLRNAIVKETIYGVQYQRWCDYSKGDTACQSAPGMEKKYEAKQGTGWYLRICDQKAEYPRKSVETIALTAAHYLDLANRNYLRLKQPSEAEPADLTLNVMPLFTDLYDNFSENGQKTVLKKHIVNNIGYYGSEHMVIIFPASREWDRKDPGFFWESQFVFGHEYGHHVERTRTAGFTEHLGIRWNPLIHNWEDEQSLMLTGNGQTEYTQMLGTVSEGFADLIGYYGEGGTAHSLSGIPRLGTSRNVGEKTFGNGDEKVLTHRRLNLLVGREQPSERGHPDEFYTDIHTGGAILARAADEIFRGVSLARSEVEEHSPSDIDYRYQLALRWMSAVGEGFALTKNEDAETHLKKISDAFALIVEEALSGQVGGYQLRPDLQEAELKSEVCKVLENTLHGLMSPAFALNDGSC